MRKALSVIALLFSANFAVATAETPLNLIEGSAVGPFKIVVSNPSGGKFYMQPQSTSYSNAVELKMSATCATPEHCSWYYIPLKDNPGWGALKFAG
jgi:hypothetical protein